jgi:predicted dehydrogenase
MRFITRRVSAGSESVFQSDIFYISFENPEANEMGESRKKAKIGIIGCGRIARQGHLPYLKENPLVELVGAMDVDERHCKNVCKSFGIDSEFNDIAEMLDRTGPDGVIISTPNWVHKTIALMAAERGIHVFVEKPMAVNAFECEEIEAACIKAGVKLQLGMAKRFDAGIVKAKKMIVSGELGNVTQINTSFLNPPPPRMDSRAVETIKKWGKSFGIDIINEMGLWRMTDERTGGGQMLEMGHHLIDIILFLTGAEPSAYSGFINKNRSDMRWEDQGSMLLKFPSGLIASAESNMSVTADNLIGESGFIYGDKSSLKFHLINGMWFGLPFYHFIPTILLKYGPLSPITRVGMPIPVKVGKSVYMYKLQMDYFVDSILGRNTDYFGIGPDFAANGRDGIIAARITDAIYASDKPD